MLRKCNWLLLVAVIVSTQVFTVACDARCGKMALTNRALQALDHFSRAAANHEAVVIPPTVSRCKDLLCNDDSASLTIPFTIAPAAAAHLPATVDRLSFPVYWIGEPSQRTQRRSSSLISACDPVLASPRI